MSGPRIVSNGEIDPIAIEVLAPFGEMVVSTGNSEDDLLSVMNGAVGLILRAGARATASLIEAAEELKVIGRPGVGCESVDLDAATGHGIPVVYTPGANARAMAEASLALILALCKDLAYWDEQLKAGNWESRFQSRPSDLDGAILGIIGLGNIGRMLAELVAPFNMTVIAYDPYVSVQESERLGVTLVGMEELMSSSRFIAVHAPLTDETRGMISRETLKLVVPGSYLVNLARGGLVESLDVLYEAMKDGRLAGVGLDVFDPEPPDVSHPIFRVPNCLTAPHSLGLSERAMTNIFRLMAEDMAAVLSGGRPKSVANPEVLEAK